VKKRIGKTSPDHVIFQNTAVSVYGPVFKVKTDPLVIQYIGIHKGSNHYIYKRNRNCQNKHSQQSIAYTQDYLIRGSQLDFDTVFHFHPSYSPSPSLSLDTTKFTTISRITLITELKSPTAVEYP